MNDIVERLRKRNGRGQKLDQEAADLIEQQRKTIAQWEECGDKIMLCVRGKAGPLSDSDVCGEIERLRENFEALINRTDG